MLKIKIADCARKTSYEKLPNFAVFSFIEDTPQKAKLFKKLSATNYVDILTAQIFDSSTVYVEEVYQITSLIAE